MSDYFAEHSRDEDIRNDSLAIARLIVEGGWSEQLGLSWEMLFPDSTKAASPEAIASLERLRSRELAENGSCPVCLANYQTANDVDVQLIRMPCKHLFHEKCLLPWLKRTNSCPVCRNELPSYDPLYETYKKQQRRQQERDGDIEELHDSMFS